MGTLWRILTLTLTAHDAGTKERVRNLVFQIQTSNCQICNSLTSDQRQQLATPSYKLKKEKHEASVRVTKL